MPYYPPYPYRPSYGGGYYPSNGYNRPPNYNSGCQNNGTIIINNPGGAAAVTGIATTTTAPVRTARAPPAAQPDHGGQAESRRN